MELVRLCAMLLPLAWYVLRLGFLNSGRRPALVDGVADTTAAALAVVGLVVVAPLSLVLQPLLSIRPPDIWLAGLSIYFVAAAGVTAYQRQRLVFYNFAWNGFREWWQRVLPQLDPDARQLGHLCELPNWGIEILLDPLPALRNVSLVVHSGRLDRRRWRAFQQLLGTHLAGCETPRRAVMPTLVLVVLGLALLLAPLWWTLAHPEQVPWSSGGY